MKVAAAETVTLICQIGFRNINLGFRIIWVYMYRYIRTHTVAGTFYLALYWLHGARLYKETSSHPIFMQYLINVGTHFLLCVESILFTDCNEYDRK